MKMINFEKRIILKSNDVTHCFDHIHVEVIENFKMQIHHLFHKNTSSWSNTDQIYEILLCL
jgi:hypothetical protein